jgi:hypothetical protein
MTNNHSIRAIGAFLIPALAGMIVWALPLGAQAQQSPTFSGAYLREICKSDSDGKETVEGGHTACQAYIAGVLDYHGTLKALGTEPSLSICFPRAVPVAEMQKIVLRYIERNPPVDAFAAAPAVIMALAESFPCKRRRR